VAPVSAATGEISGKPELVSRGLVYLPESGDLMTRAAERVWSALAGAGRLKRQALIERTQEALGRFFFEETKRKPMVVVVVTEG
jgi:ribonuclease J